MITLRNVTLRRGARVLLEDASATINPGEKVGLVGKNGAGKSSLFALLAGDLHEDGGDCAVPPHWRIAQVAQQMPEAEQTATDFVQDGDTRLVELRALLRQAEAGGDGMRLAQLHSDLADAGAHDARARAQALILGLGFDVTELEHPVNRFSGGWRMRLALARALMSQSDLLLLDEPTNHLDLDALVWLEGWLKRYDGTLVVISHDREFLDAVTGVTLQIEHGRLARYGGNYSQFEELHAQQLVLQQAVYERQQQRIAHLQKFIDRFKAKATKARQAQSRVKALERMERIAPVLASADFTFEFREPIGLPNPMLAIKDAVFGYRGSIDAATGADAGNHGDDDGNDGVTAHGADTVVLRGVNRSVLAGQRIGILGANGQGKSTLVKTIAHELHPLAGKLTEGKGLAIGYFAQQELDVLREGDTALEHMTRLARDMAAAPGAAVRQQDLRNFLGSFNFGADLLAQPVGTMSGGEKARLVLAMIVWQRPNLLLLDEPTNHLDLATREALAVALNEFEGTVMLVSHDRALLRAVCDEFWLVAQGQVTPFDGDLDDYQRWSLENARRRRESMHNDSQAHTGGSHPAIESIAERTSKAEAARQPQTAAEQRRVQAQRRQQRSEQTKPMKTELVACEQRMAELGSETARLEALLATNPAPAQIADTGRRLKAAGDELQALEDRWLDLSQQIEQIEHASGP
ncbi:MAG: Bis-ABC ATPase YheS [Burkholderiaceae bacterium]|jgi:ATP-binding cassette subfamily F protein 3|nr:MAG: Bis-ABC ATPase YheS [Burkholderiaceae bacterium]